MHEAVTSLHHKRGTRVVRIDVTTARDSQPPRSAMVRPCVGLLADKVGICPRERVERQPSRLRVARTQHQAAAPGPPGGLAQPSPNHAGTSGSTQAAGSVSDRSSSLTS